MRRLVFFTIALVIGGCSLFVDLDGLSGAGPGDGDTFVPDDARVDSASDAPLPPDAGPDAYRLICPDASIVCDDFDHAGLGVLWTGTENQNGTLTIDDGGAMSPPQSLHVVLLDNPTSLTRINRLDEDFTGLSSLDCQFEVNLGSTDDSQGDDAQIFGLSLNASGFVNYEIQLNMRKGDFTVEQDTDTGQDGGAASTSDNFGAVDAGTWKVMRYVTDFQHISVYIDGVLVYDQAVMTPYPSSTADGTFYVGQVNDGEPAAWDYRIDDVVCTGK